MEASGTDVFEADGAEVVAELPLRDAADEEIDAGERAI